MADHLPRICERRDETYRSATILSAHHGCGSPSYAFRCPTCGREGRFNTNYLGKKRVVVCDGVRFKRRIKDLKLAVHDYDLQEAAP